MLPARRFIAIAWMLTGCVDPAPADLVEPDGTGLTYPADWSGVVALSEDACVSCHAAGASAEGTPMPLAIQFDVIAGNGLYVVPFEPDASRLWRVLSGDLIEGDQAVMPLGTGPLPVQDIDHVRLWIEAGAVVPDLPRDDDEDGVSTADGDCDDADPEVYPGAEEVCDGIDNDCDGTIDLGEGLGETWFPDADGDGWGDTDGATSACEGPDGYVALSGDCDDTDTAYHPGADETDCGDPNDYNCDGSVGNTDADGDGFTACEECNDGDADDHPGADERCDGLDNDCDGSLDEDAIDAPTWWKDDDGDGFGNGAGNDIVHCDGSPGWVQDGTDCDDTDAAIHPGVAIDIADGLDNDCDGSIDEDYAVVSHAAQIQPIWNADCTNCHGGFIPSDGLSLSGNAYNDLVGMVSTDVAGMNRVEPGDPANSYLWHKLVDTHLGVGGSGTQMPKLAPQLSQIKLDTIEQWILDGALP